MITNLVRGEELFLLLGLIIGLSIAVYRARYWRQQINEREEQIQSLLSPTKEKNNSPIITPKIHATKGKRTEIIKSAEAKLNKRTQKIGISLENIFDKPNDIFHGEHNILSGIFSKGIPSIKGNLQSIFLLSLVIILSGTSYVYFTRYQTSTQSFLVYEQNHLNFQNQYYNLEENYLELLNTTSILEQYYSDTRVMYDTLRDEYSDLQKIQANIISENAKFQQEYSLALAEKNEIQTELDEIISFSKNETLVANASYELGSGGNLTLIYDLQYAGYIEITFNATTDIYMWIGSSITEGTYYSRYPTFPGTSYNGHFIVPTSQTLYVFLANTNIESTSEIVISIEYVY